MKMSFRNLMGGGEHGVLSVAENRLQSVVEVKNGASPKSQMSRGNMMHWANRLFDVLSGQNRKKWKKNAKSDGNATLYALGKINSITVPIRLIFLLLLFLLPCPSHSQNYVLNVTGKVLVNGQPVEVGDSLSDNQKIVFGPKATMKMFTKSGTYEIPEKNKDEEITSVLSELIAASIKSKPNGILSKATGILLKIWEDSKRELAILSTRSLNNDEQVKLKFLCKILKVTSNNVDEMFSQYIWNYCVDEFEKPDWSAIASHLKKEYGFDNIHISEPLPVDDAMKRMEGYFFLILEDGTHIPLEGDEEVLRGCDVNMMLISHLCYFIPELFPFSVRFSKAS